MSQLVCLKRACSEVDCTGRGSVRNADVRVCMLPLADFQGIPDIALASSDTVFLLNKTDLVAERDHSCVIGHLPEGAKWWAVSVSTGAGMDTFVGGLELFLRERRVVTSRMTAFEQ